MDLIFTRSHAKGKRKITFGEFAGALALVAAHMGIAEAELQRRVLAAGGPSASGTTRAESGGVLDRVTDTAQYTGTHQHRFDADGHGRGLAGRDAISKGRGHTPAHANANNPADLSQLLDRSAADKRGVKLVAPASPGPRRAVSPASQAPRSQVTATQSKKVGGSKPAAAVATASHSRGGDAGSPDLAAVFAAFAGFGAGGGAVREMDGTKFAKLCKECKLLSKTLTPTVCDRPGHKMGAGAWGRVFGQVVCRMQLVVVSDWRLCWMQSRCNRWLCRM